LSKVAWSSDGRTLLAGGTYKGQPGDSQRRVVAWDQGGRGTRQAHAVARNTIQNILPCGTGFAVGAYDPLLALLGPDGAPRLTRSGVIADMRGKLGNAFQVSRDGSLVRFGL